MLRSNIGDARCGFAPNRVVGEDGLGAIEDGGVVAFSHSACKGRRLEGCAVEGLGAVVNARAGYRQIIALGDFLRGSDGHVVVRDAVRSCEFSTDGGTVFLIFNIIIINAEIAAVGGDCTCGQRFVVYQTANRNNSLSVVGGYICRDGFTVVLFAVVDGDGQIGLADSQRVFAGVVHVVVAFSLYPNVLRSDIGDTRCGFAPYGVGREVFIGAVKDVGIVAFSHSACSGRRFEGCAVIGLGAVVNVRAGYHQIIALGDFLCGSNGHFVVLDAVGSCEFSTDGGTVFLIFNIIIISAEIAAVGCDCTCGQRFVVEQTANRNDSLSVVGGDISRDGLTVVLFAVVDGDGQIGLVDSQRVVAELRVVVRVDCLDRNLFRADFGHARNHLGPVHVVIFIIDGRAFGNAGGCCGIQRGAVVNLGHFGRAAYGHRVAGVDVNAAIAADDEGHVAEVRRCVLKHIGSQAHVGAFGNGGCADARFEVVADVVEAVRCVISGDVGKGGALHAVQIVAGNGVLLAIVGEAASVAGNISDDGAVKSGNR